ncbi:MAG: CDP-2,3-bis-(O-geranylgeranyl)-sn-glycerol synthase [Thermoplasmatota archaeon]
MAAWETILAALWLFLPAYVANMSPVFSSKLFPKWNQPIDGGRLHKDGKRLLGDGKTWRGLVGGGLAAGGTAVALAYGAAGPFAAYDFGHPESAWWLVFLFGFTVGFVALVGDAVESYFKRRSGRDRGAPWFPFDQLDFVVFGLAAMFAAGPLLLADGWLWWALTHDWIILTTILVGTPGLHLLINRIGYWLKLKDVPW